MKITQTIEIELDDKTLTLTREEAEKLYEILGDVLQVQNKWGNKFLEKYKEELEKPIPQPIYPHYPYEPTWPPIQPYPSTQPIWCGQVTMDTNTKI